MRQATLHNADEYRRRKALRNCGSASRKRAFLWVDPLQGTVTMATFQPAQPTALAALRAGMTSGRTA